MTKSHHHLFSHTIKVLLLLLTTWLGMLRQGYKFCLSILQIL